MRPYCLALLALCACEGEPVDVIGRAPTTLTRDRCFPGARPLDERELGIYRETEACVGATREPLPLVHTVGEDREHDCWWGCYYPAVEGCDAVVQLGDSGAFRHEFVHHLGPWAHEDPLFRRCA